MKQEEVTQTDLMKHELVFSVNSSISSSLLKGILILN